MNKFFSSNLCESRKYCAQCRVSKTFRKNIDRQYGTGENFECPFGKTAEDYDESVLHSAISSGYKIVRGVVKGEPTIAPPKVVEERMSICRACEFFNHDTKRCTRCKCKMVIKTESAALSCPIGKWLAYKGERDGKED